jgi:hypothetical protein
MTVNGLKTFKPLGRNTRFGTNAAGQSWRSIFALCLSGLDWCDRPELNDPQIIQAVQAFEVDSDGAMLNTTTWEGKPMFHDDPNAAWLQA